VCRAQIFKVRQKRKIDFLVRGRSPTKAEWMKYTAGLMDFNFRADACNGIIHETSREKYIT